MGLLSSKTIRVRCRVVNTHTQIGHNRAPSWNAFGITNNIQPYLSLNISKYKMVILLVVFFSPSGKLPTGWGWEFARCRMDQRVCIGFSLLTSIILFIYLFIHYIDMFIYRPCVPYTRRYDQQANYAAPCVSGKQRLSHWLPLNDSRRPSRAEPVGLVIVTRNPGPQAARQQQQQP